MEQRNLDTITLDEVSTVEMLEMFNKEDEKVAVAVKEVLPSLAKVVELAANVMKSGGRLFYIGSGTSGKLAAVDASECPPTFGVDDDTVIAVISGGMEALGGWREETEDDHLLAVRDLEDQQFSSRDMLVGISASGNTPYVISGLNYARSIGSRTVGLCCSFDNQIQKYCEICIVAEVGPEAIMGSTRMKAGTAQKMILNMLSSAVMVKLGKTYSNLMVNVRPINKKLQQRVLDIIQLSAGITEQEAAEFLIKARGDTKVAILMSMLHIDREKAAGLLEKSGGVLKKAVKEERI